MLIPELVWQRVIVPADIRRQFEAAVQSLVEDRAPGPVTILLTGDPGTGKTSLLRALRETLGCPGVWLHASDLKTAYRTSAVTPGKGAIHGWLPGDPGLLCLDELHMGMPSATYDRSDAYGSSPDDSTTPLSEWLAGEVGDLRERGRRILVIATAWSPDDIAPAARAAFGLHIHLPLRDESAIEEAIADALSTVVLKPAIRNDIASCIRLYNRGDPKAPRGLLILGPPGVGKTEIARGIAAALIHGRPIAVNPTDLRAPYLGESANLVRQLWDRARQQAPCILLVDDCEHAFRADPTGQDPFTRECCLAFLAEWDATKPGEKVWVVGTASRPEIMDLTLRRRFTATVQLPLPDQEERRQILANRLGKSALDPDVDVDEICTCLAAGLEGMSPRDLLSFLHGAEERAVKRTGTWSDTVLAREDLLAGMAEVQERLRNRMSDRP